MRSSLLIFGKAKNPPWATVGSSVVFVASLSLIWILIVFDWWAMDFWHTNDEYAFLSLSHAINFEATLREHARFSDSGLGNHPGIPFYVVSWLCFRVASLISGDGGDRIVWVLSDPGLFYLATRIAAATIAAAAAALTYATFSPLAPWKRVLAISTFFAADPWSLLYGLTSISNETFAFPLAALFFWTAPRLFNERRLSLWAVAGLVSASGYLVKLNYLWAFVGFCTIALLDLIEAGISTSRIRETLFRLAILTMAFLVTVTVFVLLVAGPSDAKSLIAGHFEAVSRMLMASLGNSSNPHSFDFWKIATDTPFLFAAIIPVGFSIYRLMMPRRLEDRETRMWCATAVIVFVVAFLAVAGNYTQRYLPAACAILPFLWKPLIDKKIPLIACILTTLVSGGCTIYLTRSERLAMSEQMNAGKVDEAIIIGMPLAPGEARLWTYSLANKQFFSEFTLQMAGLQDYVHRRETRPTTDYSSYQRVERPYRYILVDRSRHPPSSDGTVKSFSDPNGMPIPAEEALSVSQLTSTTVLEMKPR